MTYAKSARQRQHRRAWLRLALVALVAAGVLAAMLAWNKAHYTECSGNWHCTGPGSFRVQP
jgi:uncharacterized membrane protein